MIPRRKIITSVGTFASIGLVGTVSGQDQSDSQKQNESDNNLREQILTAHKINGREAVERLFENKGLAYETTTSTLEDARPDDSDVGAENRYSESNSELNLYLNSIPDHSDRARLTVIVDLDTVRYRPRGRKSIYVDDAIGIGFDGNHWSVVGEPILNATVHEAQWHSNSLKDGGLAGVVELQRSMVTIPSDGGSVALEGVFQNLDNVAGTLWGSYEHTRAWAPSGAISSIEGGAGPISVDLSSSASTAWELADNVDPSSVLG